MPWPAQIRDAMPGGAVGRVLESAEPKFAIESIVQGMLGWQDDAGQAHVERFSEGFQGMGQWLKQGKLTYREDVGPGLENASQAFIGMLHGRNAGKRLLQVSEWTA